jgi:hypothetical protein
MSSIPEQCRTHIADGGFAVALSGGGHRAALATLGAMLALVDRGLGPKILQVASVSGGSMTNAFLAHRCNLAQASHGQLDDHARAFVRAIVEDGVLTPAVIALLLTGCAVAGVLAATALGWLLAPWAAGAVVTALAVALGLIVAAAAYMLNGKLVEVLIHRRFFAAWKQPDMPVYPPTLRGIAGRSTEHLFCMTDLVLGTPVYASSSQGGMWFRRLDPAWTGRQRPFRTCHAEGLKLAQVVRASAAFPGIPPLRMKFPGDFRLDLADYPAYRAPRVGYLADGGIWNNLGTQALREDRFLGELTQLDEGGVPRPIIDAPSETPLFCFNGSATLARQPAWRFALPVFSQFYWLFQVMQIQNSNTVLPRIAEMESSADRRAHWGMRPDAWDPANIVADLSEYEIMRKAYLTSILSERVIRETGSAPPKGQRREDAKTGQQAPTGRYPVVGLAHIDEWDRLTRHEAWGQLAKSYGAGEIRVSTTLDRIAADTALKLVARGYLNTYLVSMLLAPHTQAEIDRLVTVEERLRRICGFEGRDDPRPGSSSVRAA